MTEGTYDNRATMRREFWGEKADGTPVLLASISATLLSLRKDLQPRQIRDNPPFGHYPDLPH